MSGRGFSPTASIPKGEWATRIGLEVLCKVGAVENARILTDREAKAAIFFAELFAAVVGSLLLLVQDSFRSASVVADSGADKGTRVDRHRGSGCATLLAGKPLYRLHTLCRIHP